MTEFENQLIIDHLNLVDKVIRTRIKIHTSSVLTTYEDLQGVGREALCRAALRYRPQIGAFAPFASRCIQNAIIDHCKKENAVFAEQADTGDDQMEAAIEQTASYVPDLDGLADFHEAEQVLEEMKAKSCRTIRLGIEAIEMKLMGFNSAEIAARYNTSVNHVNACISRARKKLQCESRLLNLLF